MSQKKLGEMLGVKANTVSSWETGPNEPNSSTIKQIALICHVSTDWLHDMPVNTAALPDEVRDVAERYAALSPDEKKYIDKILSAWATDTKDGKVSP